MMISPTTHLWRLIEEFGGRGRDGGTGSGSTRHLRHSNSIGHNRQDEDNYLGMNENRAANSTMRNSPVNLLLKLLDKTYLSLPIIDCQSVERIGIGADDNHINNNNPDNERLGGQADACRIDWSGAKLVAEAKDLYITRSTTTPSTISDQPAQGYALAAGLPSGGNLVTSLHSKGREILLSKLDNLNLRSFAANATAFGDHFSQQFQSNNNNDRDDFLIGRESNYFNSINQDATGQPEVMSCGGGGDGNNPFDFKLSFPLDFNATKYMYVATSSTMSTGGILMNLFLLLILIFGARQTCNSISRSSNSTSRTNPLLIQLTLTGLILACYVLTDDIRLLNQHDIGQVQRFNRLNPIGLEDGQGVTLCNILAESPSTLSTFLPPTPFDLTGRPWDSINGLDGRGTSCGYAKNPSDLDEVVVILTYSEKYLDNEAKDKVRKHDEGEVTDTSVGKIMIESNDVAPRYIFDLTRKMASLRLTVSSCKRKSAEVDEENSPELSDRKRDDFNFKLEKSNGKINSTEPISDSNTFSLKFGHLLPLIMNLIASVHIWTVAALAYDRYCAVANPLQYLRSIYTARIRLFFIVLWTVSILLHLVLPLAVKSNYHLPIRQNVTSLPSVWSPNDTTTTPITIPKTCYTNKADNLAWQTLLFAEGDQQQQTEICHYRVFKALGGLPATISMMSPSLPRTNSREEVATAAATAERNPNQLAMMLADWSTRSMVLTNEPKVAGQFTGDNDSQEEGKICVILLLASSSIGFIIIILAPLLLITICNVSIYSIVKVHERRLSTSSGSNMGISSTHLNAHGCCGGGGTGGSTTGSVSNADHFGQNHHHHHNNHHQFKRDTCDDKSDCESISSVLINRVLRIGLRQQNKRRHYLTRMDSGSELIGDERFKKVTYQGDDVPLNKSDQIVNRSKRLVARQDSKQLIAKLGFSCDDDMDVQDASGSAKSDLIDSKSGSSSGQGKDSTGNNNLSHHIDPPVKPKAPLFRHQRLKRKNSDQKLTFALVRKDSESSQTDNSCGQCGLDGCDIDSPHVVTNDRYDSMSIINQLKMAGLSFAGVAIHELASSNSSNYGTECSHNHVTNHNTSTGNQRILQKSSSCSLGNIYTNHHNSSPVTNGNNNYSHSVGGDGHHQANNFKSNLETQSVGYQPARKSYVTNLSNGGYSNNSKYSTQLIDAENGCTNNTTSQPQNQPPVTCDSHLYHHLQATQRLPFSIGTKSAAFNVVIWLILTMLILSMPHYLIVTISQFVWSWSSQDRCSLGLDLETSFWTDFIVQTLASSGQTQIANNITTKLNPEQDNASVLQMGSVWLSCICRILFITMIPLNGWLYGIRSRSLRVSIRLVLKRYISRRQASIEINQRQRSISSVKSRDSSYINFQTCYNHISGLHKNCYYHNHRCQLQQQQQLSASSGFSPSRLFRRCLSYNAIKSDHCQSSSQMASQVSSNNSSRLHLNNIASFSSNHREPQGTHYSSPNEPDTTTMAAKVGSVSLCTNSNGSKQRFASNTIRYIPGDSKIHRDSDTNSVESSPKESLPCATSSTNSSQAPSLASSHRSLVANALPSRNYNSNQQQPQRPNSINLGVDSKTRKNKLWSLSSSFSSHPKSHSCTPNEQSKNNLYHDQQPPTLRDQNHRIAHSDQNILMGEQYNNMTNSTQLSRKRSNSCSNYPKIVVSKMKNLIDGQASDSTNDKVVSLSHLDNNDNDKSAADPLINSDARVMDSAASEFKFLITSIDHESDDLHYNQTKSGPGSLEMSSVVYSCNNNSTDTCQACHTELLVDPRHQQPQSGSGSILDWCKSLKHQVTRMLVNASIGFIAGNMISSDLSRKASDQQSKSSSEATDLTGCCNLDGRVADLMDTPHHDQCHVALLRKSSLDSYYNGMWCSNLRSGSGGEGNGSSSGGGSCRFACSTGALQKATKKLRNSLTMTNVSQSNYSCTCQHNSSQQPNQRHHRGHNHNHNRNHHHNHRACDDVHQSNSSINSTSLADQQQKSSASSHLKPPNFLKLIFDSDVHPALYSSSSALSPIKECSSNHSYASSQSSLSNAMNSSGANNRTSPLGPQQRHLSMNDLVGTRTTKVELSNGKRNELNDEIKSNDLQTVSPSIVSVKEK